MKSELLLQQIRAKDWSILEQDLAPDLALQAASLLEVRDEEVRELAVSVLNQAQGEEARRALLRAVYDKSAMVRALAARFLQNHFMSEHLNDLAKLLRAHKDPYIREQVALLLGKLGERKAIVVLEERWSVEKESHARRALTLALARLGEAKHTKALRARLALEAPEERAEALADLLYVQDKSMIPLLRPLLDDVRDAKNVGPSHGPSWIRVCDLAINTLDSLLNHPFPFAINPMKRYDPKEIETAKAYLHH
jgi:HEAT repeat protein